MKLPYVKRNRLEEAKQQLKQKDYRISCLENDLKTANEVIQKILPRLVRIPKPILNRDFGTYRLCVDIHRDAVERAFTHGGDDRAIQYIAEMFSREIERKIIQFNFARCDR